MSTDNVTPISQNTPLISESLKKALDEQQTRVWRLLNMIEAAAVNMAYNGEVRDVEAVLMGAVDYADRIHSDLDFSALTQRAAVIEDDERRAKHMEKDS